MTDQDTKLAQVPQMGAETGYELVEDQVPLRVSGYLCLVFGLLSVFCVVGVPLLFLPFAAIVFGLFALRGSDGPTPAGTKPAMLGLILAAGFGACGVMLPAQKSLTLGSQAEYFAKQYLEVLSRGEFKVAMELGKDYINRLPAEMPLEEHYGSSERAKEALQEFEQSGVNQSLRRMGPGAEWTLMRPVRIYHNFGFDKAEVYLQDRSESKKLFMILKYQVDEQNGTGHWSVENCDYQMERLVAESVL